MAVDLHALVADGLSRLGLEASDEQLDRLQGYLELLAKWNRVYNLTAITEPKRMVTHHLLDSLAIFPFLPQPGQFLDVGTGAGLPGIPLSIMMPGSDWVLLDSNGKKTRFVQQAIASLGLTRVKVVQSRVQDYHAEALAGGSFDAILSRAYASLRDFAESVDHLWSPGTRLMTQKTEPDEQEIRDLRAQGLHIDITRLQVPGIDAPRSLITLTRQDS